MRKNVITLFVGILLLGIPMVYAGKPVKNMDLYLCIGQSNMAGRGKLSPAVMDTMQNVYLLNAEDQFELAVNPLNRYSTIGRGLTGEYLGPVYSFAKAMASKKTSGRLDSKCSWRYFHPLLVEEHRKNRWALL